MNLNILSKAQRTLWAKLAGVKQVTPFYLAGGTAAALHLQHRESIDFDFFQEGHFSVPDLTNALRNLGPLTIQSESKDALVGELERVKLSFFSYHYALLEEPTVVEHIKVANLADIATMKLIAVSQRGTKKDFIDLFFLLEAGWNLEAMFEVLDKKFRGVHYNKFQIFKSLTYFSDADADKLPRMLTEFRWEQCKKRITDAVKELAW